MEGDDCWDDEEPAETLEPEGAALSVFGTPLPVADRTDEVWIDEHHSGAIDKERTDADVFFTVLTSSGNLSATATLGGRLKYVEVRDTSRLDEAGLGEEIVELASLARDRARAAQREVTVELMGRLGQDRVGVGALLQHSIGLPTYEATSARIAGAFAERYGSDDD